MTKENFEKIIEQNGILWNDLVTITIINPNYTKCIFRRKPKTIHFSGALGYHKNDDFVSLCVENEQTGECYDMYFEFNEIYSIEREK